MAKAKAKKSNPAKKSTTTKKAAPKRTAKKAAVGIPSNPELEALIANDPRDEHAWSVLEDWILQTEDPRAAIVLAERNAPPAKYSWVSDPHVTAAYDKLRKRLLGEHPKWVLMKNRVTGTSWRAGHITKLTCWSDKKYDVDLECDLYEGVLASPAGRLIRGVRINSTRLVYPLLELLARSSCLRSLRSLTLAFRDEDNPREVDFDPAVLEPFAIDTLEIAGAILYAGPMLARLRSLSVHHRHHDWTDELFGKMVFTDLRSLQLDTRKMRPDEALGTLLPGTATPKLESLFLYDSYNEVASSLVEALRPSPLLRQLRSLKLGWQPGVQIPEPQEERVVPSSFLGPEFAHLEHLTVPGEYGREEES